MISLSLLSKYRTQMMGIAIICILVFHSRFPLPYHTLPAFIANNGYAGVEIFFLLSGFGIYFGINKSQSTKEFYKKRVLRILPYYLPIVLLFSLIAVSAGFWTISDLVNNMFMTGFWLNRGFKHIFDWYIPAILVMYFITPIYFRYYKKNKALTMSVCCITPILLVVLNNWFVDLNIRYLYLFLCRIPIYFIGFALAEFWERHKEYRFSKLSTILLMLLFTVGLSLLLFWYFSTNNWAEYTRYAKEMLVCLFIVVPGCLFLAYLLSLFRDYKYPILTFFGSYTLTLYIFHERILNIGRVLFYKQISSNDLYVTFFNLICITITIILAVFWQKAIDKLIRKYDPPK